MDHDAVSIHEDYVQSGIAGVGENITAYPEVIEEQVVTDNDPPADGIEDNGDDDMNVPADEQLTTAQDAHVSQEDTNMHKWRTESEFSVDNIFPAGRNWIAPPPQRPGTVDHEGYGLINDTSHGINRKVARSVVGYVNAITSYINYLNCYNEVNKKIIQYAIEHLILTQVGMNRGVKMFGKNGVNAIFKEMKQFNDREVVKPLKKYQITKEVRDKAIGYLMFLK